MIFLLNDLSYEIMQMKLGISILHYTHVYTYIYKFVLNASMYFYFYLIMPKQSMQYFIILIYNNTLLFQIFFKKNYVFK